MPVVGYLNGGSPFAALLEAFREGLGGGGYVEGQNVKLEFRWAEGDYNRLPDFAAELVRRNVNVIAAGGGDLAARAAKAATSTIPIVFTSGDDPVATGLVSSLARPGGNLTGVSFFVVELHAKRFELISELVPQARVIALLVNPLSPQTERVVRAMQQVTNAKGLELQVLKAATESEIDTAFSALVALRVGALIQQADPFFVSRRDQFSLLAARYSIPTIYEGRQFAQAGGLISYGPNLFNVYHQVGAYVGKILKGAKAADLPVVQPTKFELVVNLRAAKAIGLRISESFLLRADEVIE
ncbi:MAG: ABC transporter substrate-binding protein [Planctomycetes bacterium]|nr:ABC transporter substrate-binding protein [Planctomycetota bacterium]